MTKTYLDYKNASFLSKLFFTWLTPLIINSKKSLLGIQDLLRPQTEEIEHVTNRLQNSWNNEADKNNPSFMMASFKTFLPDTAMVGVFLGIDTLLGTVRPFMLQNLLIAYEDLGVNRNKKTAIILSVSYILSTIITSFSRIHAFWLSYRIGMRLRVSSTGLIFKKLLLFNQKNLSATDYGHIINLISSDSQKFDHAFFFLHYIWIGPLQLIITLSLMSYISFIPGLLTVITIFIFVAIQLILNRLNSKVRFRTCQIVDQRVRILSDLIAGIRVIKFHTWENIFMNIVKSLRRKELSLIIRSRLIQGFRFCQFIFLGKLTTMVLVTTAVLLHTDSGPPLVLKSYYLYTILNLIGTVTQTLTVYLPLCIENLYDSWNSCKRIQSFLLLPDNNSVHTLHLLTSSEPFLKLSHVTARWKDVDEIPIIKDTSLILRGPQLVGIVGSVGSGKAILGELPASNGYVIRSLDVCYLSQMAWFFPGTVRENILNGLPYDSERYEQVLKITAMELLCFLMKVKAVITGFLSESNTNSDLGAHCEANFQGLLGRKSKKWYRYAEEIAVMVKDLIRFPEGDQTQIGERGINLSGGQKSRIGLARTAYSQKNIILLDDPLTAVDPHVANHLFNQCILEFLSDRLCIIATNMHNYLNKMDKIIWLDMGEIKYFGPYEKLIEKKIKTNDSHFTSYPICEETPDVLQISNTNLINYDQNKLFSFSNVTYLAEIDRKLMYEQLKALPRISTDSKIYTTPVKSMNLFESSSQGESQVKSFEYLLKKSNSIPLTVNTPAKIKNKIKNELLTSSFRMDRESYLSQTVPTNKISSPINIKDKNHVLVLKDNSRIPSQTSKYTRNYWSIIQMGGGLLVCSLVLTNFALTIINSMACDIWISQWSNYVGQENKTLTMMNINLTHLFNQTISTYNETINYHYLHIYCVLTITLVFMSLIRTVGFFCALTNYAMRVHAQMLSSVLSTRISFFEANNAGQIINRFSKDFGQIDDFLPVTLHEFIQCFTLVLAGGVVTVISSFWTILPIIPLLVLFFYARKYYLLAYRDLKRMEASARSPIFSCLNVTLQGLPFIHASQDELKQLSMFNRIVDQHTNIAFISWAATRWISVYLDLVCILFITSVLAICFLVGVYSDISSSRVGLMVTYSNGLIGIFQWCIRQSIEFESQMVSVERAMEYVQLEPESREMGDINLKNRNWPTQGHIEFENFSFRYKPEGPLALKQINLDIKPGSKVGIVGRTGSGKSSLVSALFRLCESESGRVLIDGVDIRCISLNELRKRISVIPQDPIMFSGTVRMNLDPDQQCSDNQLWDALEAVQLKLYFEALENKLDTFIVEGGSNLSAGQRQLLAFARTILGNNQILVLDEATANVDPVTDSIIQTILRIRFTKCTVLTIAHRLNTIIDNDVIVVMENGSIVEQGSPYELLNPQQAMNDKTMSNKQELINMNDETAYFVTGRGYLASLVRQIGVKEAYTIVRNARKAYLDSLKQKEKHTMI